MNLKIVNFSKFVRSIVIIGLIVFISLLICNKSFSHTETNYKKIYVSDGDTLWGIASLEKENNLYYANKDIRDIVSNIKYVNNLTNSTLYNNQELVIPSL